MLSTEYKSYLVKMNDYMAEGFPPSEAQQKAFEEALSVKEEESWISKMKGFKDSLLGTPKKTIIKSVDEEKRLALFVTMSPDDVDAHGDKTSAEEIEKACINFNMHCNKANLYHLVETDKAKIVQSFINPSEFETENGVVIKKGAWLQWWYFPPGDEDSDYLWKAVKEGKINGVSIGARGIGEELDDES